MDIFDIISVALAAIMLTAGFVLVSRERNARRRAYEREIAKIARTRE